YRGDHRRDGRRDGHNRRGSGGRRSWGCAPVRASRGDDQAPASLDEARPLEALPVRSDDRAAVRIEDVGGPGAVAVVPLGDGPEALPRLDHMNLRHSTPYGCRGAALPRYLE